MAFLNGKKLEQNLALSSPITWTALVVYHARIAYYHQGMFGVTTLWSAEIDEFVSIYFIFFVMWTGLAKWPIYPGTRSDRTARSAKQKKRLQLSDCSNLNHGFTTWASDLSREFRWNSSDWPQFEHLIFFFPESFEALDELSMIR